MKKSNRYQTLSSLIIIMVRCPKNLEKRQKWESALGVQQLGKWNYVCGNHFTSDSYIFSNARRILKSNAVPM